MVRQVVGLFGGILLVHGFSWGNASLWRFWHVEDDTYSECCAVRQSDREVCEDGEQSVGESRPEC